MLQRELAVIISDIKPGEPYHGGILPQPVQQIPHRDCFPWWLRPLCRTAARHAPAVVTDPEGGTEITA